MAKIKDISAGDTVSINHVKSKYHGKIGIVLLTLNSGIDYLNGDTGRSVAFVEFDDLDGEWVHPKNLELLFKGN